MVIQVTIFLKIIIIKTDITACTIEEPEQKYRLVTFSNRLLGVFTCLTESKPLHFVSAVA